MRRLPLILAAAGLVVSALVPAAADARTRHYYAKDHRRVCRHSAGTTGLVAGGVGGALVGNAVLGHGLLGAAAGAAGGALGGRAIDRSITAKKRCR